MNEIKRLIAAFGHAWDGLCLCRHHPAFRIELLLALVLVPGALYVGQTGVERAVLIASVMLVLIVELLNTAVEFTIDRISEEWHELSKRAKDTACAAVFVALVNMVVTWMVILVGYI